MKSSDDEFNPSISRTVYPTQVYNDGSLSPVSFVNVMQKAMWKVTAIRRYKEDDCVSYACVSISKDGFLLTSSAICGTNFRLVGCSWKGEEDRELKVVYSDPESGWGVVQPKNPRAGELFDYASISGKTVKSSVTVWSIVFLETLGLKFSCLKGRTTHRCEFDPNELREYPNELCESDPDESTNRRLAAVVAHSTYLDVFDVAIGCGLKQHLPVLSVHGIFYDKSLNGSPLFDSTGTLIGLIWFGDGSFLNGIPAKTILHGLPCTMIENIEEKEEFVQKKKKGGSIGPGEEE
jgi:hypothetical protein